MLYLVADVPDTGYGNPPQDVAALAFVFIAATYALMRIGTQGVSRIHVDRRVLMVLVLTATVFFVRDAASSPYEEPWDWGRRTSTDVARVSTSVLVGDDARVMVSPEVIHWSPIAMTPTSCGPTVDSCRVWTGRNVSTPSWSMSSHWGGSLQRSASSSHA
ncbi:MAG: hypothetical protein CM1200mP26_18100 [Acidimicrobiales bacterium]|nr:MAG: hypothetical protein CM1200mP26_18100 [Acidimicrobiales bacterium]